jgi:hypothetical protein
MMSDTVSQMRQIQAPRRRQVTKREIPCIGDSKILSVRDANQSMKDRREKKTI